VTGGCEAGSQSVVLIQPLTRLGVRPWHLQLVSLASVWLSLALWIRAKTVDQPSRQNAERRAIFVGLWPPMLRLVTQDLER
jgi:hypothetical protein